MVTIRRSLISFLHYPNSTFKSTFTVKYFLSHYPNRYTINTGIDSLKRSSCYSCCNLSRHVIPLSVRTSTSIHDIFPYTEIPAAFPERQQTHGPLKKYFGSITNIYQYIFSPVDIITAIHGGKYSLLVFKALNISLVLTRVARLTANIVHRLCRSQGAGMTDVHYSPNMPPPSSTYLCT